MKDEINDFSVQADLASAKSSAARRNQNINASRMKDEINDFSVQADLASAKSSAARRNQKIID